MLTRPAAAQTPKRQVMILGGLAALLVLVGGLYLVWARNRVNEDLADPTERAELIVEEFESGQDNGTSEAEPATPAAAVVEETGPSMVPARCLWYIGCRAATTAGLRYDLSMALGRCWTGHVCECTSPPIMGCVCSRLQALPRHSIPRSSRPAI
jgi:hypothetical protein